MVSIELQHCQEVTTYQLWIFPAEMTAQMGLCLRPAFSSSCSIVGVPRQASPVHSV